MLGVTPINGSPSTKTEGVALSGIAMPEIGRQAVLTKYYSSSLLGMPMSSKAKAYAESRNLDWKTLKIGYVAGLEIPAKWNATYLDQAEKVGLFTRNRQGNQQHHFKNSLVFPLLNAQGQVVSMYGRSIPCPTSGGTDKKHIYLQGERQGLYPKYPSAETQTLILTESIIDAATLSSVAFQSTKPLVSGEVDLAKEGANTSVLALYGTNGFTKEHTAAIKSLPHLQEIIFFFDGDQAGTKAVEKYSKELSILLTNCTLSTINCPQGEDINSLAVNHSGKESELFTHLIEQRVILFSSEVESLRLSHQRGNKQVKSDEKEKVPEINSQLDTTNPYNIKYTAAADYYIKGGVKGSLDSLKVSLQIVHRATRQDYRAKADLYEYKQIEAVSQKASEALNLSEEQLKKDLSTLTQLLEQHRNKQMKEKSDPYQKKVIKLPDATVNECLTILKAKNPIEKINELIGKSGVTGEENNRIFLFTIASSYKMPDTLHALIQGSSGSGKTRLLKIICELMPEEDTIKFTRVTDSSFYNYPENYMVHKLLGFEDIDGLKEDALYAVRELISNEILVSSTTTKTEDGQMLAMEKTVRGPISSISCTTKGAIYEDNMSRVFLIAVDESNEQTKRIIHYQQQKAAGLIENNREKKAAALLQNCIRLLQPYEVINPYANKIQLPEKAHKIRRLNDLYLSFVKQVTLLNQYQRKRDKQGRLIAQLEDLQIANKIMFDSIVLKVDELDGALRGFYEKLKEYVEQKSAQEGKSQFDTDFSQREVRQAFRMSKTSCQNQINALLELEYIYKTYSSARNTHHYKIAYWDSLKALREKIKTYLDNQLNNLKGKDDRPETGGR